MNRDNENTATFEPIAIVGVGLRAPGSIDSLESLWDTLVNKKSHNARLSTDPRFLRRFNPDDFRSMFSVTPDAKETLQGNLLDETPGLDEAFFGVSKRESACMDVQIKLLLHVAHEALEDAGYSATEAAGSGSAFDPATFGVYVGSSTDDFFKDPDSYPIDIYHLVDNQRAFLPGQISHKFGFRGPSVAMDTVCAGSMTALNDACRALATGECRAALAGGVHVMTPVSAPPTVMSLKLAGFLDPEGQCKPFLVNGGGYSRAEGCGLVVLKRLSDALLEGDRIHGVIRGMGVGSMASTNSIVRPDGDFQSVSLARALSCSGIKASDINFVEAHGPGTQKGDPAEIHSICTVLAPKDSRDSTDPLIIGSIKGNIGHSEAASGVISLMKVLAMMKYKKMAPQATFSPAILNPRLDQFFNDHPIKISEFLQDWEGDRRIATVSNFGATGYAGHIVVENVVPQADTAQASSCALPFLVSAKDKTTLLTLARSCADWLDADGSMLPLKDVSYTMTSRRTIHPYSVLVHGSMHAEVARQLRQESLQINHRPQAQQPRSLAFCFSGQGGPRVDPAQSALYLISTTFKSMVDTCYSLAAEESLVAPEDVEALELFTLEVALAEMWSTWGLKPVALAGHSFGEYAALVRAGVVSLKDALKLVGTRAALIRNKCADSPSAMAALRLPLADVRQLLLELKATRVELACINSPNQVTLAGTSDDLDTFHRELMARFPSARWVTVKNMRAAFHSRFVEPIREEYLNACESIAFAPPQTSVLSGPLGRLCLPGDDVLTQSEYLVRHCLETNAFGDAIQDYASFNAQSPSGHPDWLEMGPHSSTVGFIPLAVSTQLNLSSQRKGTDEWGQVMDTLLKLQSAGHTVNFKAFHHDVNSSTAHVDLPRYPFQVQPHAYPVRKVILPSTSLANRELARVTSSELGPMLRSHVVASHSICPASGYISLALASTSSFREGRSGFRVSRLTMASPFTGLPDDWLQVQSKSDSSAASATFDVAGSKGQLHASMQLELYDETRLLEQLSLLKPLVTNSRSIKTLPDTCILDKRLAYDLFGQTVSYGEHCQGMQRVWVTADGQQGWAVSSNEPQGEDDHFDPLVFKDFSPVLIDRACQVIGLLVNTSPARARDEIFVASEIDQMEMAYSKVRDSKHLESYASFEIFTGNGSESATAVGQVFTFDEHQQLVAAFRGIRMRRMKQHTLDILIRRTLPKSSAATVAPVEVSVKPSSSPSAGSKVMPQIDTRSTQRDSIIAVFKKTLGIDELSEDRNLADLGLDSLTAVEVGFELERLIPDQKIPNELLLHPNTTIQTIFDAISMEPNSPSSTDTLISRPQSPPSDNDSACLGAEKDNHDASTERAMKMLDRIGPNPEMIQDKPHSDSLPMVLIHDGGGTALAYRLLGDLGRTLLGIHNPGIKEGKGIAGIRHAADQYASYIRHWLTHSSTHSKVLVGGWSMGGTIAIALASAHPDLVAGVVLLDPPAPGTTPMRAAEAEFLIPRESSRSTMGFNKLVREQLKTNAQALSADLDRHVSLHQLQAPCYLVSATDGLALLGENAPKSFTAGSCADWMTSSDRAALSEDAWSKALGNHFIGSRRTVGDHFSMFTPAHAGATTAALLHATKALEASIR